MFVSVSSGFEVFEQGTEQSERRVCAGLTQGATTRRFGLRAPRWLHHDLPPPHLFHLSANRIVGLWWSGLVQPGAIQISSTLVVLVELKGVSFVLFQSSLVEPSHAKHLDGTPFIHTMEGEKANRVDRCFPSKSELGKIPNQQIFEAVGDPITVLLLVRTDV